ncbi:hypothetical protein Phum_PHUM205220 [Pediculus humanus corporis]|uniref:Uncharacterized protein n=1 Tax=Pediculus humanus subsp. corporis TaxID=121224 RepID=E0VHC6_PEDHC|nr:hypothetical protein Phum_PHUM205220 [Pediculus humanus corporis]
MDDAEASCLYSAVRRQKGKVAGEPRIARNSSPRSRPDGREMFGERVRARVFSRQALTSTAYEAVSAEGPRREATWSRRLMWRRASCEQQLDTSQSILSTRGNPMPMREITLKFLSTCERESGSHSGTWHRNRTNLWSDPDSARSRDSIRVLVRVRNGIRRGNPTKPGDAVWRSRKSFLFSMSVRVPWNPLAGRYGLEREEHRSCGGVGILQYGP